MILLRRFSAILFSICFFVLLFVGLLFNRLTLTLLEPSFYKFQLVDHSIYEFVTHDVFRSLIQDVDDSTAGIFGDDSGKDLYESIVPFSLEPSISNTTLLSAFDVSVDDILISLKRILPPSWLKEETEGVLDVIYYIKGDNDEFVVMVDFSDPIMNLSPESKIVSGYFVSGAYDMILNDQIIGVSDPVLEELQSAFTRAVPKEWVIADISKSIDEIFNYMNGEQQNFEIQIGFQNRLDEVYEEFNDVFYKYIQGIFRDTILPSVKDEISLKYKDMGGYSGLIHSNISIEEDDITRVLDITFDYNWRRQQSSRISRDISNYIIGIESDLDLYIDLSNRGNIASRELEKIIDLKIKEFLNALPNCIDSELPFPDGVTTVLPVCMPSWSNHETIIGVMELTTDTTARHLMSELLPLRVDFNKTSSVSSRILFQFYIEGLRDVFSYNVVYTDKDLPRDSSSLETIKSILTDSYWIYTETDLLREFGNDEIESIRSQLSNINNYLYLIYCSLGLLMVVIGLLGGRQWWSRFNWAFAALTISSLLIFVSGNYLQFLIDRFLMELLEVEYSNHTLLLILDKTLHLLQSIVMDVTNGIKSQALKLSIIGILLMTTSLLWPIFWRAGKSSQDADYD